MFPWFTQGQDHAQTIANATLISRLCATAKDKKRITAKEKGLDGNPKYAMRCFLLSLGFIGAEYKDARKTLLARLDGNSAWKGEVPTDWQLRHRRQTGNTSAAAETGGALHMENNFEAIKKQILAVRDTGKTNMFDISAVQRIAFDMGFYELVSFIEGNRNAYAEFILMGSEPLV